MDRRTKTACTPMNLQLVLVLVGLRYKLLWSQMRTGNGRIALLIFGYLVLAIFLLFLLLGGYGAAMAAVQSGQLESITRSVLGGLFLSATSVAVLCGVGVRDAFSDMALRRYPLNSTGRLAVRHITGFLEPVWILILAFDMGLATGMYLLAGGNCWLGWLAVLVLVAGNYLLARDLACITAALIRSRSGGVVLLTVILGTPLLALLLGPRAARDPTFSATCLGLLRFSPPFAAATLMLPVTTTDLTANLGLLLLWPLGLLGVLPHLERWSGTPRAAHAAGVVWRSHYDRVARLFGPRSAPLVAKSLRYYLRCSKVKYMFLVAPVLIFSLAAACPISRDPRERFVLTLCLFTLAGICGPLPVSTNQFGYEPLGFRRYLLAPIPLELVMRVNSYVSMLLGGAEILLLLLLWIVFAPMAFDVRMPLMLVAVAATGMCIFNAIAVWTSTVASRPVEHETLVGFNVSVAGAVLFQATMWPVVIAGHILRSRVEPGVVLRFWWVAIPAVVMGLAVYVVSLGRAGATLTRTGERLMNRLEGRP
jgi:hypothetical protein